MSKKVSTSKISQKAGSDLLQQFKQQNLRPNMNQGANAYSSRFLTTAKKGAMVMNVRRGK